MLAALDRSALFLSVALPAKIYPPLFNQYLPGMEFGAHIDNAIRGLTGTRAIACVLMSPPLFFSARQNSIAAANW